MTRTPLALVAALAFGLAARGQDANEAAERAMKAAALKVAPSVVKIETAGGSEMVGKGGAKGGPPQPGMLRGTGPTTGVVVGADGYVISSAFNFASKPSDIFVTVPGRPTRLVAKLIATDQTRMLTLLKVDAKDLPVPATFPKKDVAVGQWAIALGRTLNPNTDLPPSVSAGIVSAVNRVWGKAIQTDAKVSPVNYGGPLVGIDGRVMGILVPASARGEGETSGVEWYDSGIGFAVPMEDVLAAVPRLKGGKDLRRGLLGVTPQNAADMYGSAAVIGSILPDSAAARIGLQAGDTITGLDKKPVPNYSAVMHVLGPKYEGDSIEVRVTRGGKEIVHDSVTLTGTLTAYVNPFLGILPMRDDPDPGVLVRHVYPKSPADAAGLKVGDRITKVGVVTGKTDPPMAPVTNRGQFAAAVARLTPGTELKIEVKRKDGGKTETVTAKLATVPADPVDKTPLPSSLEKAGGEPKAPEPKKVEPPKKGGKQPDPKKPDTAVSFVQDEPKKDEKKDDPKKDADEVPTGMLKRANETLGREYWVYVPTTYKKTVSHGLIVWFHASGKGGKDADDMKRIWEDFCDDHHFILMGPKSGNADAWVPSETEAVMQDVQAVMKEFTIDKSRVAAHGMGVGGQMAFYVGFHARDVFRGVATVGSALGTPPKDNVANQPLAFFLAGGDKDPLIQEIRGSKALLDEKRFPVTYREMKETGKEYFDQKTFLELLAWLDSLDRI